MAMNTTAPKSQIDKEYWKKKYLHKWKEGNKRETIFKEFMKKQGYEVKEFGFETLSEAYNPDSPEEKGKPDFFIEENGQKVYFEVTGTSAPNIKPEDKIWLRPDKVDYVKRHKLRAYCVHILDSIPLIRFIDITNLTKYNVIHPTIRETKETYYEIDPSEYLTEDQFKEKLKQK